jgi:glyoxylase-like metal-dependent hydrolase (beta-lactamase superfamily II)
MREIVDNVYLFEGLRSGNTYLLVSDGELAMVDCGMSGDVSPIVAQIEEAGHSPEALGTLLITHAHPDHIGGASELVRRYGARVMAHRMEVFYLEGRERLPARTLAQKVTNWLGGLTSGEGRGVQVDRGLEDGEQVDILGGLRVLHTPGHTPGSMCLYQPERGILFSGDTLVSGNPITGRGGLRYGPRAFTSDPQAMERSARGLAKLQIRALCSGHGEPLTGDVSARLRAFVGPG